MNIINNKGVKNMLKYIPNMITLTRIILIPVYIFYFSKGNYTFAGIFFSISALTDFFDGFIARKFNLTSRLGKILDPLADKITIISILIILTVLDIIPGILSSIILIRELFILTGSILAYYLGVKNVVEPSKIGKLAIFLLYIALAARILNVELIGMILLYIVIPLNIYSGVKYVVGTWHKIDFRRK